jgi:hypothetical protein
MEHDLDDMKAQLRRHGYTDLDELEHERTPASYYFHAVRDRQGR